MQENSRKVYYTAKITPMVFLWPLFLSLATLVLVQLDGMLFYLSIVPAVFMLHQMVYQATKFLTFRIFVTDQSIMITRGVFSKHTIEYLIPHVSGISSGQTFFSRIFGFGHIKLIVAGIEQAPIKHIDAPKELCNNINEMFFEAINGQSLSSSLRKPSLKQPIIQQQSGTNG